MTTETPEDTPQDASPQTARQLIHPPIFMQTYARYIGTRFMQIYRRIEQAAVRRVPELRDRLLWLVIGIALLLRVPGQSQFLDDQVGLMTLARDAITQHALPLTGIPSSIGTYNPPLSVYLLLPTALFTKDPGPAVGLLVLWNVLGVGLFYIFASRYFGRRVALGAALLMATCGAAVNYSHFIWQQNYLPPLLVLWGWTLYAGCLRGRRGWLVANVALLVLITSLHPTGLVLVPISMMALLLAPRWPSWRSVGLAALVVVVLLLPTLLWEIVGTGADLAQLRQFGANSSETNFDFFLALAHLLGGPTYATTYGGAPFTQVNADTLYSQLHDVFAVITRLAYLLYFAGFAVVTWRAWRPAVATWHATAAKGTWWPRVVAHLAALWRGLRTDAAWRGYLLLWLWLVLPPLAVLRHNKTVQPHYLFIAYPVLFLAGGIAIHAAWQTLPKLLPRLLPQRESFWLPVVPQAAILGLVGLIIVGQSTQSILYTSTQDSSRQVNNATYGYPQGELRDADRYLSLREQDYHASSVLISTPQPYFKNALTYMLVNERPERLGFYGPCLLLPGAQQGDALVVTTQDASAAAQLLQELPNAHFRDEVYMSNDEPFQMYLIRGATPTLPGEVALTPIIYRGPSGERLRLDAAAQSATGVLRLRWTVLDSTPSGAPPSSFQFALRSPDAAGAGQTPLATGQCAPTRWQAGQTLFTWVQTNYSPTATSTPPSGPALPQTTLALDVRGATSTLWQRTIGPLRVIADATEGQPPTLITAQPAATTAPSSPAGHLDATGQYLLTLPQIH